jgi:hypothetical protein
VKLSIKVTLDSGGTVTIEGDNLTAEGVNEVFAILGGYSVESVGADITPEADDEPDEILSLEQHFVEGFREGRTQEEKR